MKSQVRRAGATLVAVLLVTAAAPAGQAARSCGPLKGPGTWWRFTAPSFSDGPSEVSHYDVSPKNPNLVVVTNGVEVHRSTDGGCRFKEILSLAAPELEIVPGGAPIIQLAVAPKSPSRIYVVVRSLAPLPSLQVLTSGDGGARWHEASGLSDAHGDAVALTVAPSAPKTAYLLATPGTILPEESRGVAPVTLYMTKDGETWEPKQSFDSEVPPDEGDAADILAGDTYSGLAVDPRKPKELWVYGSKGILRTSNVDDGEYREWRYWYGPVHARPTDLQVYRRGNVYVAAALDGSEVVHLLLKHADPEWVRLPPGEPVVASFVLGNRFKRFSQVRDSGRSIYRAWVPNRYAFSTAEGALFYRDGEKRITNVKPTGNFRIEDVKGWASGRGVVVFGRDGNTFYRWRP